MIAAVDDMHRIARLGQGPGICGSGETRADYQYPWHLYRQVPNLAFRGCSAANCAICCADRRIPNGVARARQVSSTRTRASAGAARAASTACSIGCRLNEKQYDSNEAAKQRERPTGPAPPKAIFSKDDDGSNDERYKTCIGEKPVRRKGRLRRNLVNGDVIRHSTIMPRS